MKNQNFKNDYDKLYKKLYIKIEKQMAVQEFFFIAKEAMMPFHDGHTSVSYMAGSNSNIKMIPLKFVWLKDGMIISESTDLLKKGDKILSIGNKEPEQILKEMKKIIPAENDEWVKFSSQNLLLNSIYLNKLGLISKNCVSAKIEHMSGSIETINLPLTSISNNSFQNIKPYSYEIRKDNGIALFHLNECLDDEGYRKMLNDFFNEVQSSSIKKVAVDLRQNGGGNSEVMDDFLMHIKIDHYIGYTDRRISQISPEIKVHHDSSNLYKGKIYVLTSSNTFSSANWFAVIFKYNKIGTIIGEPTGNAPSHYGYPVSFTLPNSKLLASISKNDWLSPYLDDSKNALDPNIYIPLTRNNVVSGNDPCIDWIIKN